MSKLNKILRSIDSPLHRILMDKLDIFFSVGTFFDNYRYIILSSQITMRSPKGGQITARSLDRIRRATTTKTRTTMSSLTVSSKCAHGAYSRMEGPSRATVEDGSTEPCRRHTPSNRRMFW
jgi:hypothetical protein